MPQPHSPVADEAFPDAADGVPFESPASAVAARRFMLIASRGLIAFEREATHTWRAPPESQAPRDTIGTQDRGQ